MRHFINLHSSEIEIFGSWSDTNLPIQLKVFYRFAQEMVADGLIAREMACTRKKRRTGSLFLAHYS